MRVVDTSAWIEWLLDSPTGRLVGEQLPPSEAWIVPTIVQFELVKWARREASPERSAKSILAFSRDLIVSELTTEVAVRAASLSVTSGLASADAIIYATALMKGADLLTSDAHFKDLPAVVYLPKKAN
jgi:predicted nucleic acid-binding protein